LNRFFPLYIAFAFCCAMLLVACTAETTCRKDMAVAMVLTLQADSINQKGHTVKYTSWDSITVELLGEYNLLFDNGKSISKLPMPLLPDTTISTFLITFHEQTDTLFVEHTPRQYFVSLACGCAIYHTITAAWSTDPRVDSVQIINANVENAVQENLCIHLHE
jgi:hypothetical protein